MESITLNITYKTDKTERGSDVVSFKILKKQDKNTKEDKYIIVCYSNDLECLPSPEIYKKQKHGVDYLIGSNKHYNEKALPIMVVGENSIFKYVQEGKYKDSLAILNNGQESPYINFENIIYMNLMFDNEKKLLTFDRTNPDCLTVSSSIVIDENFYNDINIKNTNNRSNEILSLNDTLEQAIYTMDYFDTIKKVSKIFGQWHAKERRK